MKFNALKDRTGQDASPSPRRAWIEMSNGDTIIDTTVKSPSPRRAWIEIFLFMRFLPHLLYVALPTEGVD